MMIRLLLLLVAAALEVLACAFQSRPWRENEQLFLVSLSTCDDAALMTEQE